ncbi:hypothetical protein PsAD2_00939 [Pseudovibrio axinellae]|uniref:Secreted protein n=1 Tax=Pseudovibrio axinellae TaxID=989403 RepID=A0A166AE00_9HYPH|nr:hypothetical protein [Pseudovibrio axinellae]KZL20947.1 hypothetical protein PsAD2_00939 [Pseudovibrio axinellae]SEP81842.1 hypothetical protein SAMN05421798_101462 [Pseudovibrio axinellae]
MRRFAFCIVIAVFLATTASAQVNNKLYPFNYLLPNDLRSAPRIYGSQYDCRIRVKEDGAENVYQAFVSGYFSDPSRNISSVACFKTLKMCEAYLNFMRGYLQLTRSASCQHGYYKGLFGSF